MYALHGGKVFLAKRTTKSAEGKAKGWQKASDRLSGALSGGCLRCRGAEKDRAGDTVTFHVLKKRKMYLGSGELRDLMKRRDRQEIELLLSLPDFFPFLVRGEFAFGEVGASLTNSRRRVHSLTHAIQKTNSIGKHGGDQRAIQTVVMPYEACDLQMVANAFKTAKQERKLSKHTLGQFLMEYAVAVRFTQLAGIDLYDIKPDNTFFGWNGHLKVRAGSGNAFLSCFRINLAR